MMVWAMKYGAEGCLAICELINEAASASGAVA
jgi:hypothetical protein